MDLIKIIQELRQERDKVETIISSLEQLQGRAFVAKASTISRRGRRSMDAAGRMEVSRRMKSYWENRRKNAPSEAVEIHASTARVDSLSA